MNDDSLVSFTKSGSNTKDVGEKTNNNKLIEEQLKDPQFKSRLVAFLEDKAGLLSDVLEAQSMQHSKSTQQESLQIPKEIT